MPVWYTIIYKRSSKNEKDAQRIHHNIYLLPQIAPISLCLNYDMTV